MSHSPAKRGVDRDPSRRAAMIVEQSAKTLTTANPGGIPRGRHAGDEFIVEALMIPLAVTVLDELGERPS